MTKTRFFRKPRVEKGLTSPPENFKRYKIKNLQMLKNFILKSVLVSLLFTRSVFSFADEGMWLPIYADVISGNMQKLGCKLKPEDIYNINHSSLKDAIVQVGDFCSGDIVSDKGLLFTNHHCGFDAIAALSTPEKNHLQDGFWASTINDELPAQGLTVSILVYMQDVSKRVNGSEDIELEKGIIQNEAEEEGKYVAAVFSMFEGAEHYLMVYKVFRDIRLVGTPPEVVGKFGGDTDNFMWPRHTCDFSVFRIYAGKDNEPADYSPENIPYKPAHFFPVSIKGVKEGDFTMTFGFPGQTQRYIPTSAVEQQIKTNYPAYVKILEERIAVMKSEMDLSPALSLAMAADYASLANTLKYFKGNIDGAAQTDFISKKLEYEKTFTQWVEQDETRKKDYGNLLPELNTLYGNSTEIKKLENYINVAAFAPAFAGYAFQFYNLRDLLSKKEDAAPLVEQIKAASAEHFINYLPATDKKLLAMALKLMHDDLPATQQLSIFNSKTFLKLKDKPGKSVYAQYADLIAAKSIFFSEKKANAFLAKPSLKKLDADEGMKYILSAVELYQMSNMELYLFDLQSQSLEKNYIKAQREMQPEKFFYPDANSSMRISYGQVKPLTTKTKEFNNYYTHHYQILAKEKPGDPEFDVPKKLHDLLVAKDFGQYAKNDTLNVCFISGCDITGGNSGSPLIDGEGNLAGIVFDGNYESLVSDLYFDPAYARTISVDIRYVLFMIDKFGGCNRLIDELVIKN